MLYFNKFGLYIVIFQYFYLFIICVDYDTYFHIYTKANLNTALTLEWSDTTWNNYKQLRTCKIKLIAHGYAERWNMDFRWDWVKGIKDEVLKYEKEDYCVVAIDWERGAREINYITAIGNADTAGRHLATFINDNKIDIEKIHCIGFSLGAHTCAFASNHYTLITGKKFARITGLDPAGPLLRQVSVDKRLSLDDADFVDCIHTSETFGLQEKSGHMDFLPDGGDSNAEACKKLPKIGNDDNDEQLFELVKNGDKTELRPVSKRTILKHDIRSLNKRFLFKSKTTTLETPIVIDIDLKDLERENLPEKNFIEIIRDKIGIISPIKDVFVKIHGFVGCNHLRAPRYFISSINSCDFRATMCDSWSNYINKRCNDTFQQKYLNDNTYPRMGFHADKSNIYYRKQNAKYYLRTIENPPYCDNSSLQTKKTRTVDKRINFGKKIKKKLSKLLEKKKYPKLF
ncbi:unnamed protein product [Didymodactylos carnosus]|uniref:Lipase domain-containing protein n=1 Tax=Didymodactylos carnosus TaxID=1234261 RepID=A0A813W954_9BILA|nr:unnamed protein product [Didymodactylos carnosus]CAF3640207.1 unnamed protein product [Didymodactylos carnosus]